MKKMQWREKLYKVVCVRSLPTLFKMYWQVT